MEIMNIQDKLAEASARSRDFANQLTRIQELLRAAKKAKKSLNAALKEVERNLLELVNADMITVYQSIDNGKEITAVYKGGIGADTVEQLKIKVPLSTTSLAGYVALSHRSIVVRDVYDENELREVHPHLRFDARFSEARNLRLRSFVVVPIKNEILVGVIQMINVEGGREFTRSDIKRATSLAQILLQIFRDDFQATLGPYDYLVQQGRITAFDLDKLKRECNDAGATIVRKLMETHRIAEDDIGKSLELYYRVPYLKFNPALQPPLVLLDNINFNYLCNSMWLPVSGDREEAVILIDDPSDFNRIMQIQSLLKVKKVELKVGLPEHILQYIRKAFDKQGDPAGFDDVFKTLVEESGVELEPSVQEEAQADTEAESSAIIQLVNRIIVQSSKLNASDIHVEPGKDKQAGEVRVRVDGQCIELLKVPYDHFASLVSRIKVMSRLDIAERRKPQDGKCKLKIAGRTLELRVATVPTVQGESVVMRILAAGNALPMEKLRLSANNAEIMKQACSRPHGLVLVVGPTGSGKTTTLHAVLGHINTPNRKIWTAEDPVEITQPRLQQVQVNPRIGFTFADALRAFLRADPDVILIGEMRDRETASIGIEAALTGHLVLSTLHTNSAPETITRLLDLGLDPVNFSDALQAILAQRLMRTLCPACKEAYKPQQKELDHLIDQYGREEFAELGIGLHEVELYRPTGCEACGGIGYKGRVGIHEVLQGTPALQALIYRRATLDEIRTQAVRDGMKTLKQDGIAKIFAGMSDYSQLLQVTAE